MVTVLWIALAVWAALIPLLLAAWIVWRRLWLPRLLRRRQDAFRRMWAPGLFVTHRRDPDSVIEPRP